MGRVVLWVGAALMVVGLVGMLYGFIVVPSQTTGSMNGLEVAQALCRRGETAGEQVNASARPGVAAGQLVEYYCEDGAGERRDITDQVVANMTDLSTGFGFGAVFGVGALAVLGGALWMAQKRHDPIEKIIPAVPRKDTP